MDKAQLKERIEKILSKPMYKFHGLDEESMVIYANVEATPATAYYHRREKVDIMNDLFENEIKYVFDQEKEQIKIEGSIN